MTTTLATLINLYVFPPGRREFAQARVAKLARAGGFDDLAAHCDKAVTHEQHTRELRHAVAVSRRRGSNPRLVELDNAIDRTLTALYRIPSELGRALGGETATEADTFQTAVFPAGPSALTSLPWSEQSVEVRALLTRLNDSYQAGVQRFGLSALVTNLATLNDAFDTELAAATREEVSANDLHARDTEGQDLLLETVARVLGLFPSRTLEDARARTTLLAPVLDQAEQLRASRSRRRRASDVDPTTGAVIDEPTDPPQAPTGGDPA